MPPGYTLKVGSDAEELSRHRGRECWSADPGGEGGRQGMRALAGLEMLLAWPLDQPDRCWGPWAGQSYFAEPDPGLRYSDVQGILFLAWTMS